MFCSLFKLKYAGSAENSGNKSHNTATNVSFCSGDNDL
jgi:hypothetical protein